MDVAKEGMSGQVGVAIVPCFQGGLQFEVAIHCIGAASQSCTVLGGWASRREANLHSVLGNILELGGVWEVDDHVSV